MVIVIGQAPGPNTDPTRPLDPYRPNSAGRRLLELTGMDPRDFEKRFQRLNLLQTWPGRHRRDDKFPMQQAKAAAAAARPLLVLLGRPVVLLGRPVASCFGLGAAPWHEWLELPGGSLWAVAPHPSGRSRWYNDPIRKRAAERFWKDLSGVEERKNIAQKSIAFDGSSPHCDQHRAANSQQEA